MRRSIDQWIVRSDPIRSDPIDRLSASRSREIVDPKLNSTPRATRHAPRATRHATDD